MPNTYTPNLNLPKPGTGDTGWKVAEDARADMIDTLGDLQSFSVHYSGVAVLNKIFGKRSFNQTVTIKKIEISSNDKPAGQDVWIDCVLDSGAGFVEQSKIAALAANTDYQATTLTAFDVLNTQVFGLKFKQLGTTFPGGEFDVTVHYQPKAIITI